MHGSTVIRDQQIKLTDHISQFIQGQPARQVFRPVSHPAFDAARNARFRPAPEQDHPGTVVIDDPVGHGGVSIRVPPAVLPIASRIHPDDRAAGFSVPAGKEPFPLRLAGRPPADVDPLVVADTSCREGNLEHGLGNVAIAECFFRDPVREKEPEAPAVVARFHRRRESGEQQAHLHGPG